MFPTNAYRNWVSFFRRVPRARFVFAAAGDEQKRVNARWLCLRLRYQLEAHECDALQDILNDDERLAAGYELLQPFAG